jgi:hypothetical protein
VDTSVVRAALATQIEAKTGLTVYPNIQADVTPPVAVIVPGNPYVKFGQTLGGAALQLDGTPYAASNLILSVLILISEAQGFYEFQEDLDQYLGFENTQLSVPFAIAEDPTLGGAVEWAVPISVTNVQPVEYANVSYFGARVNVDISLL